MRQRIRTFTLLLPGSRFLTSVYLCYLLLLLWVVACSSYDDDVNNYAMYFVSPLGVNENADCTTEETACSLQEAFAQAQQIRTEATILIVLLRGEYENIKLEIEDYKDITITTKEESKNEATVTSNSKLTITNSTITLWGITFTQCNTQTLISIGDALCHVFISDCVFYNNVITDHDYQSLLLLSHFQEGSSMKMMNDTMMIDGGALISSNSSLQIMMTRFEGNVFNITNNDGDDESGTTSTSDTSLFNEFRGGMVKVSGAKLMIRSCSFEGNVVITMRDDRVRLVGGIIYADNTSIELTSFTNNRIEGMISSVDGAVLASTNELNISTSSFVANSVNITNVTSSACHVKGGVINSVNGPINITHSIFHDNNINVKNVTNPPIILGGVVYINTSLVGGSSSTSDQKDDDDEEEEGKGTVMMTSLISNCNFVNNSILISIMLRENENENCIQTAEGRGAAVYAEGGNLTISFASFTNNSINVTSDPIDLNYMFTIMGGAIYASNLSIISSEFTTNALHSNKPPDTINNQTVDIYVANGGAVATQSAFTITWSDFEGNEANKGGAIYASLKTLSYINYSLFFNDVAVEGGGIYVDKQPVNNTTMTSELLFGVNQSEFNMSDSIYVANIGYTIVDSGSPDVIAVNSTFYEIDFTSPSPSVSASMMTMISSYISPSSSKMFSPPSSPFVSIYNDEESEIDDGDDESSGEWIEVVVVGVVIVGVGILVVVMVCIVVVVIFFVRKRRAEREEPISFFGISQPKDAKFSLDEIDDYLEL